MRPESVDDAVALHEAYRDVALMRWSSAPHATVADTVAYLTPDGQHPHWRGWAMTIAGSDDAIGTLAATERRRGVAEIGYLLVRTHWGQGYAREGVTRLLDLLFGDEGYAGVYADTDPDNAGSIALLERLGFRREGVLAGEWETHIGLRDSVIYALSRDEWYG